MSDDAVLDRLRKGFKADWARTNGFQEMDVVASGVLPNRAIGHWVKMRDLIRVAAERSSFPERVFRGSGTSKSVCHWRQMIYFVALKLMGHSASEIGRMVNRDHSTVSAGAKKFEALMTGKCGARWTNRLDMVLKDLS